MRLDKKTQKGLYIVLPAFNEQRSISGVIRGLKKNGYKNLIVVDDGSEDKTYELASKEKVTVLRHIINRGLGGALGTGIQAAIASGAEYILTFDSDGQHSVDDIPKMINPLAGRRADAVIGSRMLDSRGMPLHRRVGNWGLNFITFILFGVWTTDSQSGLRAFSRKAAQRINIRTNRMEVSSEIIKEIGQKRLKFIEVPIKVIYTDYTLQHGENSVMNGFKILLKLLIRSFMK